MECFGIIAVFFGPGMKKSQRDGNPSEGDGFREARWAKMRDNGFPRDRHANSTRKNRKTGARGWGGGLDPDGFAPAMGVGGRIVSGEKGNNPVVVFDEQ